MQVFGKRSLIRSWLEKIGGVDFNLSLLCFMDDSIYSGYVLICSYVQSKNCTLPPLAVCTPVAAFPFFKWSGIQCQIPAFNQNHWAAAEWTWCTIKRVLLPFLGPLNSYGLLEGIGGYLPQTDSLQTMTAWSVNEASVCQFGRLSSKLRRN